MTPQTIRLLMIAVAIAMTATARAEGPAPTQAQPSVQPPPAASGVAPATGTSLGTGFVITDQGHVLTALHVIRDRSQVLVGPVDGNRYLPAKVIKIDEQKDLALLETRLQRPALALADWRAVPVGLEAIVIGYPQPRLMGLTKKITQGIVNGDRSEQGDGIYFQISAEVQKGNSGGPVLAPNGAVIGIVQKKLNALSVAEKTRDLPQNVNYALKSSSVLEFLEPLGLELKPRPRDLTMAARPFEVYRRTEASIVAVVARNAGRPDTAAPEQREAATVLQSP